MRKGNSLLRIGLPDLLRNQGVLFSSLFLLINAGFVLRAFTAPPFISLHTRMFLSNNFYNMPLYTLLLDGFRLVFGPDFLAWVSRFQGLFLMTGALFLAWTLTRVFKLGKWPFLFVYLVLVFPLLEPVYLFSLTDFSFAHVSSEPLAYVFFLFSLSFSVSYIFRPCWRNFILFLVFMLLAAMTRPQFLFLFLSGVFLALYGFSKDKSGKKLALALILIIAFPIGGTLVQRTYNWATHGFFSDVPRVWRQWLLPHFYFSSPQDARLLDTPRQKEYFLKIHELARDLGAHSSQNPWGEYQSFGTHYAAGAQDDIRIQAFVLAYAGLDAPGKTIGPGTKLTDPQKKGMEALSKQMFMKLAFRHKADYFRLMASQMLFGHANNFYFVLLAAAAFPVLWLLWRRTGEPGYFALLFIWALHPLNCLFVIMNVSMKYRYEAFTLNPLCAVFLVMLSLAARELARGSSQAAEREKPA